MNENSGYNYKILINYLFLTKTIDSEVDDIKDDDNPGDDADEDNEDDDKISVGKIKEIYLIVNNSKHDILEIAAYIPKIIRFNKSNTELDLGLYDNELTIKTSALIWAISAPLYPAGFIIELTPKLNEFIIKSNISMEIELSVINIVKLLLKIVVKYIGKVDFRNLVKYFMK